MKSFGTLSGHPLQRLVVPVIAWALLCFSTASLCNGQPPKNPPQFGDPIPGLSVNELVRFEAGKEAFTEVEGVADGIGPVFNRNSCVACHDNQATGGGSEIFSTRIGAKKSNGPFDPLMKFGGPTIQTEGIVGREGYLLQGEVIPRQATIVARRRTPPTFGFGLVDAVPESNLILLSLKQNLLTPKTAGFPNYVTNMRTGRYAVGKFGWKAGIATLFDFAGDAYKDEMGITTPGWFRSGDGRLIDEENPPQGNAAVLEFNPATDPNEEDVLDIVLFNDFMSFLAPPPRGKETGATKQGEHVFSRIGCADCHVPTLYTGAHPSAALSFKSFHPYSDFLLHDMGSLGDGIEQGFGTGSQMRTAPLWGLRVQKSFLHDGRASTISDAILQHAGQGRFSKSRFEQLPAKDRSDLLAFLNSL